MFSVNKRRAAEQIKAAFPYIETVEVSSSSFDTIRIRVKETEPIGAIYAGGRWVVVGEDGRGLEALPVESERPSRYLYIRGADPLAEELGTVMLDERSLAIVNELRAAFVSAGLDGVGMIDLTDKTDILLDWKNQITIALGNDANLTYEIQVAVASLPIILRERGATVPGRAGYPDVFRPQHHQSDHLVQARNRRRGRRVNRRRHAGGKPVVKPERITRNSLILSGIYPMKNCKFRLNFRDGRVRIKKVYLLHFAT